VYIDVVTASGWLAINREYDVRKLDELAALAEATGIPCMIEFVTHVPQGMDEYIGDWKAFMVDISARLERRAVRISTLAEQLDWAKARESLSITSHVQGKQLVITVTNPCGKSVRDLTIDCGTEVRSASCETTEPKILRERLVVLPEIPPEETITVKVVLAR
jgi:hypothetical protein